MQDIICCIAGIIIATPFWPKSNEEFGEAFGLILTAAVIATVLSGVSTGLKNSGDN